MIDKVAVVCAITREPTVVAVKAGSRPSGVAAPSERPAGKGAVTVWAAIAVVWVIVAVRALIRWVLSDTEFAPAPLLGADVMPTWNMLALRIFEGHLPISWLGIVGGSTADLPTYMWPG